MTCSKSIFFSYLHFTCRIEYLLPKHVPHIRWCIHLFGDKSQRSVLSDSLIFILDHKNNSRWVHFLCCIYHDASVFKSCFHFCIHSIACRYNETFACHLGQFVLLLTEQLKTNRASRTRLVHTAPQTV